MKAAVVAHRDYVISDVDKRLYSSFIEHLGRAVYTGIYEPGHPTAGPDGMRQDVKDLVKALKVPMVRYPGGNFVSAYNWEDGVGPRESRPTRLDLAWHTSESNAVGIHEFADWSADVGADMMLAVNLGSRGLDEARAFLEYVNHPGGSHWSELRAANGRKEPWNVKLWCLGNEMDGPWQIGHKTADEYGRLAHETAKAMRAFDKSLELVVCGSSNAQMPTYPAWEATVLDHTYDEIDYISLHMYFNNRDKDIQSYLAKSLELDSYIGTVAGVIDYIRAKKRSKKQVYISFDEWNVWYHSNEEDKKILEGLGGWPEAPGLLEDIYNFEDVLVVALILNTFIRRADVVKIACLAQLVNVIAPIMTVKGGPAWRQSIYYPYFFASTYGRGKSLNLAVTVPSYDTAGQSGVPYVDVAGVYDEAAGEIALFAVNRHPTETIETAVDLVGFGVPSIVEHQVMTSADLDAVNGPNADDAVAPRPGKGAVLEGTTLTVGLPPHSYQMLRVKV
jgi:alpha-N-arabinofuranosidase